jgi:hypothetical protein
MSRYTVFAVYEDNLQPYATSVECDTPEQAPELAQQEADEANMTGLNEEQDGRGPDDSPKLVGFQVVAGEVLVVL